MFRVLEYIKTRNMPISKDEAAVRTGDILVLDDGVLRKVKNTDTLTASTLYAYYFCNENKKNTVDKGAPIQYVGAIPFGEKLYGAFDFNYDANAGDGLTVKAGVVRVAVATDYVFATVEKENNHTGGTTVTTETKFTTYGSGYTAS